MATGEGTNMIAYADDVVLLVSGNSRNELEGRGKDALQRVVEWSDMAKLDFSGEKSQVMMLKGMFAKWREPVVKIKEQTIRYVREVKYLGVLIGEQSVCVGHVEQLVERVMGHFNKLASIARTRYGYSNKSMTVLYKGLIQSVLTYACEFWGGEIMKKKCRKSLLRVQRQIVLRVNKAYELSRGRLIS